MGELNMSKFKFEDRVRYVGESVSGTYKDQLCDVLILDYLGYDYAVRFDDGGLLFTNECDVEEINKFKIGDRVIYTGKDSNNPYNLREGVVIDLGKFINNIAVQFDDGEKEVWWCNDSEIELDEKVDKISDTQVADEMFAALGYVKELNKPSYDILYKHRLGNILFKNDDNIVEFFNFGGYDDSITTEDHLAIHQKLKELGWIQ